MLSLPLSLSTDFVQPNERSVLIGPLLALQLGVELDDKGGVKVDDFSQSSVDSIWAIGDVSNRIPLTPVARMEGTYFAQHLFG